MKKTASTVEWSTRCIQLSGSCFWIFKVMPKRKIFHPQRWDETVLLYGLELLCCCVSLILAHHLCMERPCKNALGTCVNACLIQSGNGLNAVDLNSDRYSVLINQFPLSCHVIFLCSQFVLFRFSSPSGFVGCLLASLLACHTPNCWHLRLIFSTPVSSLSWSVRVNLASVSASKCYFLAWSKVLNQIFRP